MRTILVVVSICVVTVLFAGCTASTTSMHSPTPTAATHTKTTKTGILKPLPSQTGDATHTLQTDSGTFMVNSYSVKLAQYNNKKVTITGEVSGDTLFADEVTLH